MSRITKHPNGSIVSPPGLHFPKGVVMSQHPGNHVVVKWPGERWTKQHATQLRRIV